MGYGNSFDGFNATQYSQNEIRNPDFYDINSLKQFLETKLIYAVTTTSGVSHPVVITQHFDYCIVDEAGQVFGLFFYFVCVFSHCL